MKIRNKLLIVLLSCGLAPLLLHAAVTHRTAAEAIRDLRVARLEAIADQQVRRIEAHLERVKTTAQVGRHYLNVRKNLPILSDPRRTPDGVFRSARQQLDSQLKPLVGAREGIADVLLVADARVVYTVGTQLSPGAGRTLPRALSRLVPAAADGVQLSEVHRIPWRRGRYGLFAAAPVRQGGRVIGLFVLEIDLEAVVRNDQKLPGLGRTGEMLFAIHEGRGAMKFLHRRRHDPPGADPPAVRLAGPTALPMQRAIRGQRGAGSSVDYSGADVMAAWRPVSGLGAGLVVKIDASEALRPVARLQWRAAGLAVGLSAVLLVITLLLARSFARPITAIQEGARVVASGDLTYRLSDSGRRDEIGELSRAFDAMTGRLQATLASRNELQQKERELLAAQEELQRERDSLDKFFSLSLDLLCIAGVDGRFRRVNAAFDALGYSQEVLLSTPFLEFVHPDDRAATVAEVEQLARGIPTVGFENRYRCEDGSYRWLLWSSAPDPSGTLYAVARDITDRRAMEEELRQTLRTAERSNAELEAFAYSVSHDLRAPLRSMDGFSRLLLEDHAHALDGEGRHYLERVRAGAVMMGQLIDGILALSRLSRVGLKREEVDLAEVARRVAASLEEGAPGREVTFVIPGRLPATGDRRLLGSVLQNLLGNAFKFTAGRPAARIELGVTEKREYFVRDDGVGFDDRYADKLFGTFQRLHPASAFEGLGIGLATVQRIVHRHGGRVRAESQLDHGATFFFTLE